VNLPFIEKIWRVKGSLPLDGPQGPSEVFEKLDPLLKANGTSYQVDGNTLAYKKDNPAAQDKLATFTSGTLRVAQDAGGSRLDYDLKSPALLLVFLAPLLFLGFGQLAIAVNAWDTPADDETEVSEEKADEDKEDPQLNPIDAFLGAPEPETLEEKKAREEAKEEEDDGKHNPIPAFVLAGIFAILYIVGRILEPWLIRRTFRQRIFGETVDEGPGPQGHGEAKNPG